MADAFDRFQGRDSAKGDAFDQFPVQQESTLKSLGRTALQVPQGVLEGTGPGLAAGLFQLLALGESDLSPEEFHKLRELAEQNGQQFNEESYEEARQQMLGMIPTVSNIGRKIEEETGLPLEPKENYQKLLRLGSTAAKMQPGSLVQKGTSGVVAPATTLGLEQAGLPEVFAEPIGLGVGVGAGSKAPKAEINFAKKKPSGLTERRFENLETPTEISAKRLGKLNEKVENEFKDIADDIISKSPIGETLTELKNNSTFKQTAKEGFQKVQDIAEQIPEKIYTKDIKESLASRVKKKEGIGFLASEYEKEYQGFIKQFIDETKDMEASASDIVKQFRKNNKGYSEIKEPGKSYAYNQAKRDALREYNLALEDVIRDKFKGSELPQIFDDVNKNWSKIMDAEVIDGFVNDLFDGKIQFKKGRDFFEKNGYQVPFKRALGEKGYKDFETLINDLMGTERAHKLLKAAESKGFSDLAKTGLSYLVHPTLAKAKFGFDVAKATAKSIYQMTLDKPQLAIKWDKGVKAMKKGDFKSAEKEFGSLEKERTRQEALGKFNEKIKKSEENPVPSSREKAEPKKETSKKGPSLKERKASAVEERRKPIEKRLQMATERAEEYGKILEKNPDAKMAKIAIKENQRVIDSSQKLIEQLDKEGADILSKKEFSNEKSITKQKNDKKVTGKIEPSGSDNISLLSKKQLEDLLKQTQEALLETNKALKETKSREFFYEGLRSSLDEGYTRSIKQSKKRIKEIESELKKKS